MTDTERKLRTYRPDAGIEYRYNPANNEIEWRNVGDEERDWTISTYDTVLVKRLANLIETPYEP